MLLDLHIDRNELGTFVTSDASKPICRLAWIQQVPASDPLADWYVDTLDGQPRLGPFDGETEAIVAAFDYVQSRRMYITLADGSIQALFEPGDRLTPDRNPWPGFAPLDAQEASGAVLEDQDGPTLLRNLAAALRASQTSSTAKAMLELADRWEREHVVIPGAELPIAEVG